MSNKIEILLKDIFKHILKFKLLLFDLNHYNRYDTLHIVTEKCMEKTFKRKDLITRIVVLATDMGMNIADSAKSLMEKINKTYNISWMKKKRIRDLIDTEFFIWSWSLALYYGSIRYTNRYITEETSFYQKIFEDYFAVVMKNDNSCLEIFDFWKNYVQNVLDIPEKDYQGRKDYNQRVLEKLTNMLSLKILKYIHSDIVELDVDKLNEMWGQHIIVIQEELEVIVGRITYVLNYHFNEANEAKILAALEEIRSREPVKSLIKKWQSEYS